MEIKKSDLGVVRRGCYQLELLPSIRKGKCIKMETFIYIKFSESFVIMTRRIL